MPPGACAARARHSARWSVETARCCSARCDALCSSESRAVECASAGMTDSTVVRQWGRMFYGETCTDGPRWEQAARWGIVVRRKVIDRVCLRSRHIVSVDDRANESTSRRV